MHKRSILRLLCTAAAFGLCGLFVESRGQDVFPALPETGAADARADDAGAGSPVMAAAAWDGAMASQAEVSDLAAQMADLAAQVAALEQADAEAAARAAGRPTVTAGGRIMLDWANYNQDPTSRAQAGDFANGTEVRRARVYLKGEAFDVIDYKLQFELAASRKIPDFPGTGVIGIGQVSFKDVYITIKELPHLGHVRVGHFKTPFGLENLTSHRFATFMERAMISEGEIEGRRLGIVTYNHSRSERSTWAIGLFTSQIPENPPRFQNDVGGAAVIMRLTHLPWYDEAAEGRKLLHLGAAYSHADIGLGNTVRFDEDPESHLASQIIDTGVMTDVDSIDALGLESALVYGPLSLQGEFVSFWLKRTANPNPFFHGAYGYISYFLTGENRRYVRDKGTFDRIHPFQNFFRVRGSDGDVQMGIGAWEIAYRYSFMDLNSNGMIGGLAGNHTFALNWYLNPYTRFMWNYVASDTSGHFNAGGTGHVDIIQMRFQIDF